MKVYYSKIDDEDNWIELPKLKGIEPTRTIFHDPGMITLLFLGKNVFDWILFRL